MHDYWQKQDESQPLFPDLIWSRPENRSLKGKLLIVGGNIHGFAALGEAFIGAEKAGVGEQAILMPDKLMRTVGPTMPQAIFGPSTPSGSLGRQALASILDSADSADACLLAGDFGKNSETAILLDSFIEKYSGKLSITQDALDYFLKSSENLMDRDDTLIVASFAQLQKLAQSAKFPFAITSNIGIVQLVERLHEITANHFISIIVNYQDNIIVALAGKVSSTKFDQPINNNWQVSVAAKATTWWLQNPSRLYEAATSSLV